jgi:hypothetical protein
MKRTLLALCLSLVAGLAIAGEAAGSRAYDASPQCPKAAAKAAAAGSVAEAGTPAPATPATTVRVRGGGGGTAPTRLTSPRWHTLLPGMFR